MVRTWAAAGVESTYAPPVSVFLQRPQVQMPTDSRLTATLAQKGHSYLDRCEISIFLMIFRREAPYRVAYFPVIPAFLVRFPCRDG